ncbi:hypothetical protein [Spirosoma endophyticum]|uniref:Uncharacterized protein n=1 Tax=Spirosoma endophyticum TaxID=662367 RepID=A0A1I2E5V8_9BACT|nr:hypothetical protein [Spirosoma endophyticum]SFE88334.1 hypothetical protein SAMN05216167_12137 [Spirosoma endophyticum]
MMPSFDTEWAAEARLTFGRLPIEVQAKVQADLINQIPQLVKKYADLHQRRPAEHVSVGAISHLQVPDWRVWLRLDTEYFEDEIGPVLFIYELNELTGKEFVQSQTVTKSRLGRNNPSNSSLL